MFSLYRFLDWLYEVDKDTPHTSRYHKESLYEHTIAVAYEAALTNPSRRLFLAALLHDIGKPETLVVREGKGSTFYNHETHLDMIKYFLTEDDVDYVDVCDLITFHMIPYTMKGPDPWRMKAVHTFNALTKAKGAAFMQDLMVLHECDMKGTFSDETKVPDKDTLVKMIKKIQFHHLYIEDDE